MTERHNIWLRRVEDQREHHGAVRADAITAITTSTGLGESLRLLVTVDGKPAAVGTCTAEHRDRMVNGLLSVLCQAEHSDARYVVIEAVPQEHQDGPDQPFFWVHENEWPASTEARQPAAAARGNW